MAYHSHRQGWVPPRVEHAGVPVLLGERAVPRPQTTQWRTHGMNSPMSTCMMPASRSTARARRRSTAQKHLWAEDRFSTESGAREEPLLLAPFPTPSTSPAPT